MTIQGGSAQVGLLAQSELCPPLEPHAQAVTPIELLLTRARLSPAGLAYSFLRDDLSQENVTYKELEQRIKELAARIATRAHTGDRALLVYGPGLDAVIAFWACLYAGVVAVPAPSPDAVRLKSTLPRLRAIAADARTTIVLSSSQMRAAAEELSLTQEPGLSEWLATDLEIAAVKDFNPPKSAACDLAYLQYTSGSTSSPRGVMITHANVTANCATISAMNQPKADSRVLSWLPYFHDYGLVYGIVWPVLAGMPGYLMSPVTFLRRPLRWLEAIERFQITHTGGPNFAYAACSRAAVAAPNWHADLSTLRAASCGAEPINPATLEQFNSAFAPHGLAPTVFSPAFGLAEATLLAVMKPYGTESRLLTIDSAALRDGKARSVPAGSSDSRTFVSCGVPAHDTQVALVDTESGLQLPADRVGEIWLASASVGAGYWGRREATLATFEHALPTAPGCRFMRTGDLGFFHDGELYITGRLKDLIIIHGRNYYPQDIEWAVERADSAMRPGHGAAFSVEAEDGEHLVVVQEVDKRAQDGDLDIAVRAIRAAVAAEHDLPLQAVVLIKSGSIARTSSGKIRRNTCKQEYLDDKLAVLKIDRLASVLDTVQGDALTVREILSASEHDARQSAVETFIRSHVARLTRRDAGDLLLSASAIECGIDSLAGFRLLNEIETALGIALPASSVLAESSLRGLAARIVDELERVKSDDDTAPAGPVLSIVDRRERMPLSPAQERMWFWEELAKGKGLYNLGIVVRLDGELNEPALVASLCDVVDRHEVLRSRVVIEDGVPLQTIEPQGRFTIARTRISQTLSESELAALCAAETRRPIDLFTETGVRATLLTLTPESHRLLWIFHHSVCDGWSVNLLLQELTTLYASRARGAQAHLPTQSFQYLDYAAWERQWLAHGTRDRELAYWTRQLEGAPTDLDLPTDHPRGAVAHFRGASLPVCLSKPLSLAIRQFARESGLTPFMILLATWQWLLGRYAGRETVLVGAPVANRARREHESIIGYFANTLALRADLDERLTMLQLFEQVRSTTLGAYDHQQVPFEEVVNALRVHRESNRPALVQTFFTLQPQLTFSSIAAGVSFNTVPGDAPVARFDLSLVLSEAASSFEGVLEYDADLFEAETLERWIAQYASVLERAVAEPSGNIGDFDLITDIERTRILDEWNNTKRAYPSHQRANESIAEQARRTPNSVAVTGAGTQLTYAELDRRSNQLAHHLRGLGVVSESTVGICLERSPEMIVALLAVMKAGGAYVPLDPAFPPERLALMANDAELVLLITQTKLLNIVPSSAGRTLCLDESLEEIAAGSAEAPPRVGTPDNLAYILYTSGSTGQPKGVEVSHRALVNFLHSMRSTPGIASNDVLLAVTTLSFDIAGLELYLPLIAGARVELASRDEASDAQLLLAKIGQVRPTILQATPATWRMLIEAGWNGSAVLTALCGGEGLPAELAAQILPRVASLWNLYGPTETTIWSTLDRVTNADAVISIGRPIANTTIYILDRDMRPVPPGVRGELFIGGDGLARGYHNRPDLTAERFIRNPFSADAAARLYRTGDIARYMSDGRILHLGRSDHQVKIRGFRIELGEIESVLDAHARIKHSVAVAREDEPGVPQLVAYYVGEAIDANELREHLREHLPEYMIPCAFVALEAMPLTPNGKVDRKALPAPNAGPASGNRVAPRTALEQTLWGIWRDVLKHEGFGIQDSFFEVGGHSLSAARVLARIRAQLGREVRLRVLFEAPTIAALALRLQNTEARIDNDLAIVPGSGSAAPAISASEASMWFVDRLFGSGPLYNMPYAVRLQGSVDMPALDRAFKALVQRHSSLRTAYEERADEIVRVIQPHVSSVLSVVSIDAPTGPDRETKLQTLLKEASACTFDLTRAPLIRATLFRLTDDDQVLLIVIHHIVSDGWSMSVMTRDLGALYSAFHLGTQPTLPVLPIEFGDYAVWQNERSKLAVVRQQMDQWRAQVAGLNKLELPTDRRRPAELTFRGGVEQFILPTDLVARLEALARTENATLYAVLLAAFKTLLSRYAQQEDFAVATPLAGRTSVETEGLIGNFVNTPLMRLDLTGDPTFRTLLQRARQAAMMAVSDQDLAFGRLTDDLSLERSLSRNTLVQVALALQNVPPLDMRMSGLQVRRERAHSGTAKLDLFLFFEHSPDGLTGDLEYSCDIFDSESVQALIRRFDFLLRSIVDAPDAHLSELPMMDDEERHRVLVEWNETARSYDLDKPVHERIAEQARRTPDAIALSFEGRELNYAELHSRSDRLAAHLRELGAGTDVPVALCMERSVEIVVALLAVLKAGAAYMPMDPEYPADRLAFMLEDSATPLVLTQEALRSRIQSGARARIICLDTELPPELPANAVLSLPRARPDDAAYIIYTSGSTGRPKGVVIPHRGLTNHMLWMAETLRITPQDRSLQKTSISFDASVYEFLVPLMAGAVLVVAPPGAHRDVAELARIARSENISILQAVPSSLRALLDEPSFEQCRSLRYLVCGGEALDRDLAREFLRQMPQATLGNFYGVSEATDDSTHCEVTSPPEGLGTVPIGKPIANVRCYVLDKHLQPVPVGAVGELHIGGAQLARGYLNRPELNAQRFLADPFLPGERLFRTGDLASYRRDGTLEYRGRADAQVKVRGFRIELGEIEAAINACSGVKHSVVLVREDEPGRQILVAYLVADASQRDRVREELAKSLPDYMVPAAFVMLSKLPLLPNGKLDRKALPAPQITQEQAVPIAPRDAIEQTVWDIWADVLGRTPDSVHQSFFELGGHSLLATQVVSRTRNALQIELPLRAMFEGPTVAGLATRITQIRARGVKGRADRPIEIVARNEAMPVSFSQRRMWLIQQLEPQGTAYNMPFALRMKGKLDPQIVETVIDRLVQRHEAFRTTFAVANGEPVQVVQPHTPIRIRSQDLRSLPESERRSEAARLFREEAMRPFDLAKGPLMRVLLARLGDEDHVMLWLVHHAAADQWSGAVVGRELGLLYRSLVKGESLELTPLKIQYADFAAWQRRTLGSDALDEQLEYWREKLRDVPVLALPADRPRPAHQSFAGSHVITTLSKEMLTGLKRMSARQGATPYMALLACFKLLLSRYTGQDDVVVGSPIANRTRVETEPLVGTFVNTLPMRTDLSGDPTFAQLLARVRNTAVDAYAHQDLPFERLVEELGAARERGHAPIVQVLFNVPNAPSQALTLEGLTVEPFDFDHGTAQFDLSLNVETEIYGRAALSYSTELFDNATANRMLAQYVYLIEQAVANPQRPLSQFDLLTPVEMNLMRNWNETARDYPHDKRVDQLVAEVVQRSPNSLALGTDSERLTYSELNLKATQFAHHMQALGVGSESPVGICLQRSADMIVALLATMKAGGAYVPLDPAFPVDRLQAMAEDAGLVLLVTHSELLPTLPKVPGKLLCVDAAQADIAKEPTTAIERAGSPTDLAYILYTSGSTGKPKGVEISHGALTNFLWSMRSVPGIDANDTFLAVTTLSFDIAGLELFLPLICGARVELASRDEAADARMLLKRMDLARPTMMQATPTMWRMLIEAGWSGSLGLTALCGGEALPPDLAAALTARTAALWNMYGPTETTIWSTLERISAETAPISIGRPIANTTVHVLDKALKPVPTGVGGELYIGGDGVARGYRNRPDLTEERFIPDPFSAVNGARLYRTGDLARFLADGRLLHLGRLDHQVKIRGFRIELGEIESVLAKHPGIAQTVVAAKTDMDGEQQLVAYVIARDAQKPDPSEFRSLLRTSVPEYMIPSHFVFMDAFPLTANRKVNVPALPAPTAATAAQVQPDTQRIEPRGRLEVQLTALWRQVLGDDTVGVHDNFFDRGGHSLKAVQLLSFLEQVTGQVFPLATLFQAPSVAEMAALLTKANWKPSWRSLVAVQPSGRLPPIFAIPGVGGNVLMFARLSKLLGNDQPFYGLQARGLDNAEKPFKSIPKMAAHYVSEIRSVQKAGPFIIAGTCTGGVIGYEVARQLLEQGQAVKLILLDSWHPRSARSTHRGSTLLWPLRFVWLKAFSYSRALAQLPIKEWSGFFKHKAQIARAMTARSIQDTLAISGFTSGRVVEATWQGVAAYEPRPLQGTLLNVIADEDPIPPEIDTRRMWEPLVRGGSEAVFIHAKNSGRLFMAPYVTELAAILARHLGYETDSAPRQ